MIPVQNKIASPLTISGRDQVILVCLWSGMGVVISIRLAFFSYKTEDLFRSESRAADYKASDNPDGK